MNYLKIFISAIAAGCSISFGGMVFLSLDNKIAGAFFFTVGLFIICTFGFHLFTGKVAYVLHNDKQYAISLPVIWIGNLIGAFLTAHIFLATRIAGITEKAQAMCQIKADDSLLSLFILGIECNIFVYLAVEGYNKNPHEIGKYLSLVFGIMVFILCGFEHCVADMFYISVAGMWSLNMFVRVLVITAGNIVGAVGFNEIKAYVTNKNE
ncbi:MAG: formate/nitrite transporter family protein [Eubacteriales bacterium]|nr:formate/nitrite transporter family protein [Eubacteriales bacterium]